MPWPFSRKKKRADEAPSSGPQAPRAAGADEALVEEILTWLRKNVTGIGAVRDPDALQVLLGAPPPPETLTDGGPAPAGAILKVKRGKLTWVDLYDPSLRGPVNDLVKHLDRLQKWSFNGVISTKYREERRP